MINNPDVCQRLVFEDNDERHILKQAELEEMDRKRFTHLSPRNLRPTEEVADNVRNAGASETHTALT